MSQSTETSTFMSLVIYSRSIVLFIVAESAELEFRCLHFFSCPSAAIWFVAYCKAFQRCCNGVQLLVQRKMRSIGTVESGQMCLWAEIQEADFSESR